MSWHRSLVVLLAGAVLLAACGGGSSVTETAPTTRSVATIEADTTTTTSTPSTQIEPTTTTSSAPTTTTTPAAPPPTPRPVVGGSVFVLGDSALLGARDAVPTALPGWNVIVDAVGSRRLPQAIEVLRARRGEIGDVAVIQQGNNHIASEGSFGAQMDEAMRVLDGVARRVTDGGGEVAVPGRAEPGHP